MATSGLDHDIKLWAPTAESPTGLKGLKEVLHHILTCSPAFFIAEQFYNSGVSIVQHEDITS